MAESKTGDLVRRRGFDRITGMDELGRKRVCLIVPCYNERDVLPEFFRRVEALSALMPDYQIECLYVDDGSVDGTSDLLWQRSFVDPSTRALSLSRNFGHQAAITAGLDHCQADMAIVLDADLQDPPELVKDIVAALERGADVVHMVRSQRLGDSWTKRWTAKVFYRYMRRYGFVSLPEDAGDFKGLSRRVLDALRACPERVRFLRGVIAELGFSTTSIDYVRDPRFAGHSKYPWGRVIRLAADAVLSHSSAPMRVFMAVGAVSLPLSVVALAALGFTPVAWVACLIVLYGGLALLALGLAGEYLVRILMEVKHRPLYLVRARVNLPAEVHDDTYESSATS